MGFRRKAREHALQILYQLDVGDSGVEEALSAFWQNLSGMEELKDFVEVLVRGAYDKLKELDQIIQSASHHWKVERMAQVDRNILRLAVYELFYMDDIPFKVTLNEAIELGKRYGTGESSSFINGVLDSISDNQILLKAGKES